MECMEVICNARYAVNAENLQGKLKEKREIEANDSKRKRGKIEMELG